MKTREHFFQRERSLKPMKARTLDKMEQNNVLVVLVGVVAEITWSVLEADKVDNRTSLQAGGCQYIEWRIHTIKVYQDWLTACAHAVGRQVHTVVLCTICKLVELPGSQQCVLTSSAYVTPFATRAMCVELHGRLWLEVAWACRGDDDVDSDNNTGQPGLSFLWN